MIFKQRPYTLKTHRSRFRPVHAALIGLSITAIAIPLASNWNASGTSVYDAVAEAGFVASERPFDRLLSGKALGGRRLTDPAQIIRVTTQEPAFPTAAEAQPPVPEAELPVAALPLQTPVAAPSSPDERDIAAADALAMPFPRPKPVRVASNASGRAITSMTLPPLEPIKIAVPKDSIALNLPESAPASDETPRLKVAAIAPKTPSASGPRIAIVLAAAGLNPGATRAAISRLPGTVTLAFAPIGEQTPALSKQAVADGHLVLAEIPMEPMNALRDPGEPLTLRVSNTEQENVQRLRNAIARVSGAKGVSSYLGARFSRSIDAASPVLAAIKGSGNFLFENQPGHQSQLRSIAHQKSLPYAAGNTVIDINRNQIAETLITLEARAKSDGIAIGVGATHISTVDALALWMKSAESRGITFVPVAEVAEKI